MEEPLIQNEEIESKIPNEKVMTRLIKGEFRFERRQYIFLNVNTVNLVLTIYNLIGPINIEAQKSLIFYEDTRVPLNDQDFTLMNLLNALIVVHLLRIFTCLLGFFSVSQKSGKIMTYFMIMSTVCVLCRGIISLLIVLNYTAIKDTCNLIFGGGTDDIGSLMAMQFLVVLILFVIAEILLALISLIQCSKTKEEYRIWIKHKEKMMKNYELCYEVAICQLDE
ncbi:unnamed protein product (macronuclear) [Paramecium tetraurelia]|uniref:Uncharacterized protein n=1 Tax=Paramecium tetraurelia TaxID=5888 RepID=A0CG52_PARTE|nr:uncharacterized protein GSPATT00038213001 [Paramecium tetraurelia]CAK69769.1 unnamed protein product [Paramecium tetraurelia]|eukprot:XP_001437166.1 hypothetical protein (macronuclear) [Paramecium tetraurelia strain d4-2]